MSRHIRSVRARVLLVALVPVLSLAALCLCIAGIAGKDVLNLARGHQARVTDPRLLLFGGLGVLAVVAAVTVSLLVGRGLVRELSDLRRSAGDLAAGQARLREGIGELFRNLTRRNQSLLHRQLALLDRMERRTEDPQELEDLFRLDHLTTRMRRHAESLIVLSGQSPARAWRNPVPFVDVIRAAVAEVEDYTRVSVISAGDTGLAGPAVGDVIHTIAELTENATIYSPPNTPVVIQGGVVGRGFAVEIEDRGLGMSDDALAEANASLADPLPFEPANADQLGLLVAGQLAKRHDIQITLRRNPYGGTTAIVLLPHGMVVAEGFGEPEPGKALEGTPLPAYQAAPPAVAPSGTAADTAAQAEAGSPAQGDTHPPVLPRRVRQASLAARRRDGAPAHSSLPGRFPGLRPPEEAGGAAGADGGP